MTRWSMTTGSIGNSLFNLLDLHQQNHLLSLDGTRIIALEIPFVTESAKDLYVHLLQFPFL